MGNRVRVLRWLRQLGLALMLLALFWGWQNSDYRAVEIIWPLFIPGLVAYIFARMMEKRS